MSHKTIKLFFVNIFILCALYSINSVLISAQSTKYYFFIVLKAIYIRLSLLRVDILFIIVHTSSYSSERRNVYSRIATFFCFRKKQEKV